MAASAYTDLKYVAEASGMNSRIELYSAVGEELTHYEVDIEDAALLKRASVQFPASVQYAWPHPSKRYLYVASSNRPGGLGSVGTINHLGALRINPQTGGLAHHGESRPMHSRAIHMSLDATGGYALIAHNEPSGITVMAIGADGTIGSEVRQSESLDVGIYAHQVRTMPSNRSAILVTRGNSATKDRREEPGALKIFSFKEGVLANEASVAPGGGFGFGPRHLDFHPTQPWVYVSLERQSQLCMFRIDADGLAPEPAFVRDTLADRDHIKPRQVAGTVHVHPNGQFVYLANRADCTVDFQGMRVFDGGENSIVVCSIDPATGEPTFIQRADPRSFHVRTFAIDPSGRMLVAASIQPLAVREGAGTKTIPAALTVFRICSDGKLEFVRKYDIDTRGKLQFWMGMVALA